jgi:hypothetical protein
MSDFDNQALEGKGDAFQQWSEERPIIEILHEAK